MNEAMEVVRKFKVSELNRLLLMVRENIERKLLLNDLKNNLDKNSVLLKKVEKSINYLNELPELLSETPCVAEALKESFKMVIMVQEMQKVTLTSSINRLTSKISDNSYPHAFENSLFLNILSTLTLTDEGFLKSSEIQDDFLKEYIYIFTLRPSFIKKIFVNESDLNAFKNLVYDTLPEEKANILNIIEDGNATSNTFFEIFF